MEKLMMMWGQGEDDTKGRVSLTTTTIYTCLCVYAYTYNAYNIYIYGHRPLQGLPFLILAGGDAIEIFTIK